MPLPMYITLRLDLLSGLMKDIAESAHQKRDGVSVREVRLLLQISDHPGLTLSRLVELSFMEKTMVSKAITALTRTGLVVRHVDGEDARKLSLELTRKGKAVADRARDYVLAATDNIMSALTPEQRSLFDDALGRLAAQLLQQKEQGLDLLDSPRRAKAASPKRAAGGAAPTATVAKVAKAGKAAKPGPSAAPALPPAVAEPDAAALPQVAGATGAKPAQGAAKARKTPATPRPKAARQPKANPPH